MHLLLILFISFFSLFSGKHTEKARIYLEKGSELIAYQMTGEKGKVNFDHLDAGSYKITIIFPQQGGKYTKVKSRQRSQTKAAYNPRKKTYYYQGNEGYFAIHFSGIDNIKSENFLTVFEEEHDEENTYNVIARFGAHRDNADIHISVETLKAAQFKKASEKAGSNISTLSIPDIR